MHCTRLKMPDGGTAIVCGARRPRYRCASCGAASRFQCDWKVGEGKTCDRHLCELHAQRVAPEKDLCPEHQAAYGRWLVARANEGAR